MVGWSERALLALVLVAFVVSVNTPGLHAQVAGSSPHPNFIFFRYASLTSLSLYGAYGKGKWLGFFGMVQNPRTSYREIAGGVAANVVVTPRVGGVIALAAADASDGWYGQVYLQSNVRLDKVTTYLSTAYYEPLEANGARQVKVNPALVMWRAFRRVEAGGACQRRPNMSHFRRLKVSPLGGEPVRTPGPPAGSGLARLLKRGDQVGPGSRSRPVARSGPRRWRG